MAGGASHRLRNLLVMVEVALAVILVVGAGLMTKSFLKLLDVDPGFRPERLLVVNFTISAERHPNFQQFYHDVIERVRAVPGVLAAGAAKDAPFRGIGERINFVPPGMTVRAGEDAPSAMTMHVSDGYFRAIGTPILSGREFTSQDRKDSPFVIVINQALAKQYFPNQNPVGQTLSFGQTRIPIIGVVGDIRQTTIEDNAKPTIYINEMQNGRVRLALVVRTASEPRAMARRVQDAIWELDKQQTITAIFTFDDIMSEAVARPRLFTVLLGLFGGLGFILGALGIYGVLAYLVNQRRQEIGVRIALGAQTRDVLRMVVGRGLALGATGVAAGIAGALLVTRFMQGVLYGVETSDPATFIGVALALLGVAALASWVPAWRATKVDPAVALRSD
jgi:predicted permease